MAQGTPKLLGWLFRSERKKKRLTQAEAADRIGSSQSQVSAFENGDESVLSKDKIDRLAKVLDLDLSQLLDLPHPSVPERKYCTNPSCATNMPYVMGKAIVLRPKFVLAENHYCAVCGELMLAKCQECGAEVRDGIACTKCGHLLVMPLPFDSPPPDLEEWAERQRRRHREILGGIESSAAEADRRQ